MNTILIQTKLQLEEINQLLNEFPQYLFLSIDEEHRRNLDSKHWEKVEIFFGDRLTREELAMTPQLRWIHTLFDNNNQLPFDEIEKQGNIIVSNTKSGNLLLAAEFVMSAILAFSKHLFHWKTAAESPDLLWESKWREGIWTLADKSLLQIGLEEFGSEIANQAKRHRMKVLGAQARPSFHPFCQKTIAYENLHTVLPNADVVVVTLPKENEYYQWFGKSELELMKKDSILIILGNNRTVDEEALAALAENGHFRGVVIDVYNETPISSDSPLWKLPNIIITPSVAYFSSREGEQAFRTFRYNLRQYIHGNFTDMRNVVAKTLRAISLSSLGTEI